MQISKKEISWKSIDLETKSSYQVGFIQAASFFDLLQNFPILLP